MIRLRPSGERGHARHGWLETHHTFSFADYHDDAHMGFRCLRVINENRIAPGQGFGSHGHRDMEILTWILSGQLEHKDSMRNGRIIQAGELQAMSAGTGVQHSEFNPSSKDPTHLLQIWITPKSRAIPPSYAEWHSPKTIPPLLLLASESGADGSVRIHQDVHLFLGTLNPGATLRHPLDPHRAAWIQLLEGRVEVLGKILVAGDGAALEEEAALIFKALDRTRFLLFDLP